MKHSSQHILEFLEEWAPQSSKLEYDNVGLLIGDARQQISRVSVCLDVTGEVIDEAVDRGAQLIVAHHPLIFRKLSRIHPDENTGSLIYRLIRSNMGLIAAHTNLDAAYGGVSYVLAENLGLRDVRFLSVNSKAEESADHSLTGFGAMGSLDKPMTTPDFLQWITQCLDSPAIRYSGNPRQIGKVAVCGGAGGFLIEEAIRQHADAMVTADLKYHDFFVSSGSFLLVDAGHYESEVPVVDVLRKRLEKRFPELEFFSTEVNTNPVCYMNRGGAV